MILPFDTALYFIQAVSNVDNVPPTQVSPICPVCGKSMAKKDNNDHLVYDPSREDDKDVVVIVACNGHRILDPNICGLPDPTWVQWKDGKGTKDKPDPIIPGETKPTVPPKPKKTAKGGGLTPEDATEI